MRLTVVSFLEDFFYGKLIRRVHKTYQCQNLLYDILLLAVEARFQCDLNAHSRCDVDDVQCICDMCPFCTWKVLVTW